MITVTRDIILKEEGLEDFLDVDLNDSRNYVAKEETFFLEARVAYALMDMGLKPNLFVNLANEDNRHLIKNRKSSNSKFAITEMLVNMRDKDKFMIKICEVLPKLIGLQPSVINRLGYFSIEPTDIVMLITTPAEFKRMLLIFRELKYRRNTHHILKFEIPVKEY